MGYQRPLGFVQSQLRNEVGAHILDDEAEVTACDLATADQIVQDVFGEIDGYGKADAIILSTASGDGGVDADDFPVHVDEWAAGIAGIDGGIGLEKVLVLAAVFI